VYTACQQGTAWVEHVSQNILPILWIHVFHNQEADMARMVQFVSPLLHHGHRQLVGYNQHTILK
jgi:hypothetical protein